MGELNKNDIVYYCRLLPTLDIFEINKCKIRTVESDYFVATEEKTKQAFMFTRSDYNKTVFKNRGEALKVVREAENKHRIKNRKRG